MILSSCEPSIVMRRPSRCADASKSYVAQSLRVRVKVMVSLRLRLRPKAKAKAKARAKG